MDRFSFKNRYQNDYFEGWYTRLLSDDGAFNLAVIFAVTTNQTDPHAFIQIFDGNAHQNTYLRFPLEALTYDQHVVEIEQNRLAMDHLKLKTNHWKIMVDYDASDHQEGKSAMGVLQHTPLECFQEVIVMEKRFTGSINTQTVSGTLYMEKTFGRKFPKRWFWLQANRFDQDVSLALAGGHVPTIKLKPFGFFCLLRYQGKTIRFATYNLARLNMKKTENMIVFTIKRWPYRLIITVEPGQQTTLVGPGEKAQMNLDVAESLTANLTLTLNRKKEKILHAQGEFAGLEWMYD